MSGSIRLTLMEESDIRQAARVLSLAMLHNPLHLAMFQGAGEAERQEIDSMFYELFCALPGVVFLAKEQQQIVGVMRMKSCVGRRVVCNPDSEQEESALEKRKKQWIATWAERDPQTQHWHLGPIGVLPAYQGAGIGTLLMERFCREVDLCRAEAYLETDLDTNVRFYEKFGFRLIDETEIFGVPNRFMLRDVRE